MRRLVPSGWHRYAVALVAVGASLGVMGAQCQPAKPPPPEPHGNATFRFTGGPQAFTVPDRVNSITVDALGAAGGGGVVQFNSGGQIIDVFLGGRGGEAQAAVSVTPGEVLGVVVGGEGNSPGAGGFNGGGPGGTTGAGGGGASDVRRAPFGDAQRLVVGGGGGGRGAQCEVSFPTVDGGSGGGTEGDAGSFCTGGTTGGGGGTQSAPGAAGTASGTGSANGSPGSGSSGGAGSTATGGSGGGGGGGWFGGGGGAVLDGGFQYSTGGGGGSGFTPSGTGMTKGVRTGNGQVTITW